MTTVMVAGHPVRAVQLARCANEAPPRRVPSFSQQPCRRYFSPSVGAQGDTKMQSSTQFQLMPRQVREALGSDWALLRGIVAIGFGVFALAWPSITLVALILLFGSYALVD